MAINLNKKLVSKDGLLQYIKDIDVYRLYSGEEVDMTTNILSPIRAEDHPSFGYFVGESGEICFNDFTVKETGDFVKLLQLKFGYSFFEALSQIATDFNLTTHFHCKTMTKFNEKKENKDFKSREEILRGININKLGVRMRKWAAYDLAYWEQFGITKETLIKYKVFPIDYIFFDTKQSPIQADKYAYVFYEFKDNRCTMKIYQPFNKEFKWLNNHNDSIWQGWTQLPKKGNQLIITKSLKDVMTITSVLNIPAVSLQSESVLPKQHIIDELDRRFETMYLLYDNDFHKDINIGLALGARIVKDQNIIQLTIPTIFQQKDISDLVKNYGKKKSEEIFHERIKTPF
jgi:hypothetical protein|tara:strand:+ start:3887 stop:4921 length:1035 start_codon:yes stop_codon:yes gene_type:complete